MNKFQKRKNRTKEIALERIEELFRQAELRPNMAERYVILARKISSRTKTKIPLQYKRRFCKHCNSYLVGTNSRIRLTRGKKTYFCMNCKTYTRIPYK